MAINLLKCSLVFQFPRGEG